MSPADDTASPDSVNTLPSAPVDGAVTSIPGAPPAATLSPDELTDLPDDRYLNRELSWLDFNSRVLALAGVVGARQDANDLPRAARPLPDIMAGRVEPILLATEPSRAAAFVL